MTEIISLASKEVNTDLSAPHRFLPIFIHNQLSHSMLTFATDKASLKTERSNQPLEW
jgi:hypothetical protein